MTTQIWTPQRFVVPALAFSLPPNLNYFSSTNPLVTYIDLLSYVTGGRRPFTFTISPATPLPTGIKMPNSHRGVITGVNPQAGNFPITVTVTDAYGSSVTASASVSTTSGPLTINSAVYPDIFNGIPYNYTPVISGGRRPYSVVSTSGPYPGATANLSGLIFDNTTGKLSGTPVYTGGLSLGNTWGFTVTNAPVPPGGVFVPPPNSASIAGSIGLHP